VSSKRNPRPVTSFYEDDFEVARQSKEKQKAALARAAREDYLILAIRIVMPVIAIFVTLWLYTMVDNFIAHQQYLRFSRSFSSIGTEDDFFTNQVVGYDDQGGGDELTDEAVEPKDIDE